MHCIRFERKGAFTDEIYIYMCVHFKTGAIQILQEGKKRFLRIELSVTLYLLGSSSGC